MLIDYDFLGATVQWIEDHEHTVDLLKWVVAGFIAWMLGIFQAIREWVRRPSISINPAYSHCYYEQHDTLGQHANVALLAFIVDVQVINPTNSPLAVRSFEIQVRRFNCLKRWSKSIPGNRFSVNAENTHARRRDESGSDMVYDL